MQSGLTILAQVPFTQSVGQSVKVEKAKEYSLDSITFTFSENSNFWQESLLEAIRQNITE